MTFKCRVVNAEGTPIWERDTQPDDDERGAAQLTRCLLIQVASSGSPYAGPRFSGEVFNPVGEIIWKDTVSKGELN